MNDVDGYYDDDDYYYEDEEYDENDDYYEEEEVNEVVTSLSTIEINSNINEIGKPSYKDILLIPEKRVFIPPPPPQVEIKPWRPELAIVKMKDIIGDAQKNEVLAFQGIDYDEDDDGIWGLIDSVARCKYQVSKNQQNRSNTSLLTQKQQEIKMKRIALK